MGKRLTTEEFSNRSNEIHNNKFDYSLVEYINNATKVRIVCPIHGEFQQIPLSHLAGIGCEKCGRDLFRKKMSKTTDKFINESIKIHKNKYEYSHVDYKNNATKVKIYCKKCKEFFFQSPNRHLSSSGCWKCNHVSVLSRTKWNDLCNSKDCSPIIYIIRCFNESESFIKIGRTMQLIHRRFCSKLTMPYEYEVIKEIKGSSNFVFDKEHELHRLYKKYKYIPNISFAGKYECFNISILQDILKHS